MLKTSRTEQDLLGMGHSLFEMPEEDSKLLRQSFESVKPHAQDIGLRAMQHIFERAPETLERFQHGPNRVMRKVDQWEMTSQGITILSAIERCILRLNQPRKLEEYIRQLVNTHIKLYSVPVDELTFGLDVFQSMMLEQLDTQHDNHRPRNPVKPHRPHHEVTSAVENNGYEHNGVYSNKLNKRKSGPIVNEQQLLLPGVGLPRPTGGAGGGPPPVSGSAVKGRLRQRRHSSAVLDMMVVPMFIGPPSVMNCDGDMIASGNFNGAGGGAEACEICSLWRRFFRMLSSFMQHVGTTNEKSGPVIFKNDDDDDDT